MKERVRNIFGATHRYRVCRRTDRRWTPECQPYKGKPKIRPRNVFIPTKKSFYDLAHAMRHHDQLRAEAEGSPEGDFIICQEPLEDMFVNMSFNTKTQMLRTLTRAIRWDIGTVLKKGMKVEVYIGTEWQNGIIERASRHTVLIRHLRTGIRYRVQPGLFRLLQDVEPESTPGLQSKS